MLKYWFQDMDLSLLHNDISFNVLSRFPANILIQLKLVSKGWLWVIEDPDLMHYWQMKMGNQSLVSGFFFQEKFMFCDIDVQKLSYIPTRAKETKIYHTTLDFLPEKVTIWDQAMDWFAAGLASLLLIHRYTSATRQTSNGWMWSGIELAVGIT